MNLRFRNLVLFALTVALAASFSSCKPTGKKSTEQTVQEQPKEKFIGLQLWSVRDDMGKDPSATIKAVGEMGYSFVETAGYADGKFYGMEPTEFKALCDSNNLKFLGSHTGQDVPAEGKWDETMAWWDTCIAAHKAAGVQWIVQPWMGESGYTSLEGLKKYCEYFNVVGEKCNAAGIRFGYHNHDKEFSTELDGKPVYDWMLEFCDPEKVMFQLDLYWITEGGKNALDYFNSHPGRFELWHVKDSKELGGEDGKMDFAPIFSEVQKAGVKYAVIEVEEYNFEPLESCKKSLDFLKEQDFVKLYE